jgi:hypothetical protein
MANPFREDLELAVLESGLTESEAAIFEAGADWAQTRRNRQVVNASVGQPVS